jgi:hypothetical protein
MKSPFSRPNGDAVVAGRTRTHGRYRNGALLALTLVIATACERGSSGSTDSIVAHDSAGIAIVENDVLARTETCAVGDAPVVSIGSAQGEPEYELYRVFGASRLSDGRIALVNQGSQELRFYDAEGRWLSNSGRGGQGPGEFLDAFYLWVLPGDTLLVGDYPPWQFEVFGPDGEWVRAVRPTPEYPGSPVTIAVLSDGRLVLANRDRPSLASAFEPRYLTVLLHAADGTFVDTIGEFPNGHWGKTSDDRGSPFLYPFFESFTRVAAAGDRIVIGNTSMPEYGVYDSGETIRLSRIVRWTTGPRSISDADVEVEKNRISSGNEGLSAEMRRMFIDPQISPNRPVADEFPAFASVDIGRDGRTWVQQYAHPRDPASNIWMAFDRAGAYQCTVHLPIVNQVLEFGEDYVLVLDRDELDAEIVSEYTLGPALAR